MRCYNRWYKKECVVIINAMKCCYNRWYRNGCVLIINDIIDDVLL